MRSPRPRLTPLSCMLELTAPTVPTTTPAWATPPGTASPISPTLLASLDSPLPPSQLSLAATPVPAAIAPTRLACSTLPSGRLTRSPRLRLTPLCSTLGPAPTATLAWAILDTLDTLDTLDIGPSTATPTLRMVTSVTKNCQTKNDQTEAQ